MIKRLLINLLLVTSLLACTSTKEVIVQPKSSPEAIYQSPDDGDQPPSPPISPSDAIIVDHTLLPLFSSIPVADLQAAASIKTLFMHQSTGDNIVDLGLKCLAGINDPNRFPECTQYSANPPYEPYDNRNWDWTMWNTPMSDAIAKTDQWVSVADAQQEAYQVLGMKYCYVDGWNQDFDSYRQAMEQLERKYPQKIFIWTTSALWAQNPGDSNLIGSVKILSSSRKIQKFNQQLRAYAHANNKILYDLADIESHDLDGNPCQFIGFEALCNIYTDGKGGGDGGHPDVDGSIRLAQGFWLLMARIAGWSP